MKSLSETQPDLGLASAPVDVQVYVDGRAHTLDDAAVLEVEVEILVVEVASVVEEVEELPEVVPLPVHGRH